MKFSTSIVLIALATSSSVIALAFPQPTPAIHRLEKRQQIPPIPTDSAEAESEISSILANPTESSLVRSIASDPAFQQQVSSAFDEQFGTASGSQLYQSYESVLNSLLDGTASPSPTNGSGSSSNKQSGTNSASNLISIGGALTSMIALGAGFVFAF